MTDQGYVARIRELGELVSIGIVVGVAVAARTTVGKLVIGAIFGAGIYTLVT